MQPRPGGRSRSPARGCGWDRQTIAIDATSQSRGKSSHVGYVQYQATNLDHQHRHSRRRQPEQPDRRAARAAAGPGLAALRKARPLQPGANPRARRPRQGLRRLRHADDHAADPRIHEGKAVWGSRQDDRVLRALFDRRRRARRRRRRARRARVRRQVLHRRRQLGPRRQQHAGVLRPRSVQVLRLHPHPEARPEDQPAQHRRHVGLLVAEPGKPAPGHDPVFGPRPAAKLPAHARIRLPHLQLDQRRQRTVLGQIPLQDQAGHRKLDRRRGDGAHRQRPGEPPARPVHGDRKRRLPAVAAVRPSHARGGRRKDASTIPSI